MALVIESGDCTQSESNVTSTTIGLTMPSYADGDLVILNIAFWQDGGDTQELTWPAGPNSESITSITTGYGGEGAGAVDTVLAGLGYFIGDGAYAGGTFNVTTDTNTRWNVCVIVVPEGEFDSATPISSANDSQFTITDNTTPDFGAFSASSTDGGGKLIALVTVDQDSISGTPTGWTDLINDDAGRASIVVSGRDAAVTDSESITASGGWTIATDAWAVWAYIVRDFVDPSITDAGTDEEFKDKDTGIVLTGVGFGASQGSATVELGDNATYATANKVSQTITTWGGDTSITITVDLGSQSPGTKYLFVTTDNSDTSDGLEVIVHRATAFELSASSNITASGEVTTAQLTAPATKTTGDFSAGRIQDDENPADAVTIGTDEYTEFEWSIEATTNAAEATYDFRVTLDGVAIDTYTVTPQMTVSEETTDIFIKNLTNELSKEVGPITAVKLGGVLIGG